MTVTISRPDSTPLPSFITDTPPAVIEIPASKSLSHRALIAAALADGISEIRNLAVNDDISATVNCLRMLGARIGASQNTILVHGISDFSTYDGTCIDCASSASTLRFLLPLFAQSGKTCRFTGSKGLLKRPLTIYEELYGLGYTNVSQVSPDTSHAAEQITVSGPLKPGIFALPGNISSQFISGLLFLLPMLEGDSVIDIHPPFESESYVRMTIDVLRSAGVRTEISSARDLSRLSNIRNASPLGRTLIKIPGGQRYVPSNYTIGGDWSSAAFFIAQSMLSGAELILSGITMDTVQGDRAITDIARSMGAEITETTIGEAFLKKPAIVIRPGSIQPVDADLSDCPDLGPVLFALATQARGTSVFRGISRLRLKESDRIASMEKELAKLGCRMHSDRDTVWIDGPSRIHSVSLLNGHDDHRIVMALSVLASRADNPVCIEGAEAVSKSYPEFFTHLAACGMDIETSGRTSEDI